MEQRDGLIEGELNEAADIQGKARGRTQHPDALISGLALVHRSQGEEADTQEVWKKDSVCAAGQRMALMYTRKESTLHPGCECQRHMS